jgi:hypothetical protein
MRPDVIFAGNETAVIALQQTNSALPIVFVQVVDLVAVGFVASLVQPAAT